MATFDSEICAITSETTSTPRRGRPPMTMTTAGAALMLDRHEGTIRRMAARGELISAPTPEGARGLYLLRSSVTAKLKELQREQKAAERQRRS